MRTPALVFAMLSYLSVCFSQTRFYDEQKPISIQTDYSEIVIHFENKTDFDTFTKRAIAPYSLIKIIPKYLAVVVAFGPGFQPHVELNELAIFDGLNIRNSFFARKLDDNFKLYLSHRMLFAPLENLDPYGPEIASFISRYGNGKIESNPFGLFYSIELDNPLATLALANALVENGLVAWAHPDFYANHTRHIDPLYSAQFQMHTTGQSISGVTGVADIDCDGPEAWAISTGASSQVVAVIDDGLVAHPDMNNALGESRILTGYTPATGGDGTSLGNASHGVACGGIIAASHNNIGVRGIAPEVKLRSVNIFTGDESTADLANAFTWAKNQGVSVMSNSWGYSSCTLSLTALNTAINDARTTGRGGKGCVVVFSSGNDYMSCVAYPADLPYVVGVGAVTSLGAHSEYANTGPTLDLVAPSNAAPGQIGAGVRTTDRPGTSGYSTGDYNNGFGGTSAACPLVSGVAMLIVSANPDLTDIQVRNILTSTASDMGTTGFDNTFGHGRVNAHQALLASLPQVDICNTAVTAFPYTQSFENGLGDWTQTANDDMDWIIGSGSTPTANTGPSSALAGTNYLFIESSSPNYPSKVGIINSPCLNLSGLTNPIISFGSHLYGATIGELRLEGSTDGSNWTTLWSLSGNQGNTWQAQTVSLNVLSGSTQVRLRFRGSTTTNFTGDLAIDEIVVSSGSVPPTIDCSSIVNEYPYVNSFESALSDWSQPTNDQFNWTRQSGSTATGNTGPAGASNGNFYYYVESSLPNYPAKSAILKSPCFDLSSAESKVVKFNYHMYGTTTGQLKLQIELDSDVWTTIWELSGNQGNAWIEQSVSLADFIGYSAISLRFVATTGTSFTSDMAIDHIQIENGGSENLPIDCLSSADFPYTESFENALSLWTDDTNDHFNWTRNSGTTPSASTGPNAASDGMYYYFIESSAPNYPNKKAILNSPCLDFSDPGFVVLSFDYHMYGSSTGNLKLQAKTENASDWTDLWSLSGNQGLNWKNAQINLETYQGESAVNLRFVATTTTNYFGDMAIDAINLAFGEIEEPGECPLITISDVQSFGGTQDNGAYAISPAANEITLTGNAWKSMPFNYTMTANTMLSFDFKGTVEGEIHGIGFENDNNISGQLVFQVHGTQNWGILNFNNYSGIDWVSYTIPAGIYIQGTYNRLVFACDNDANLPGVNGSFRNIRVFEAGQCTIPSTGLNQLNVMPIFGTVMEPDDAMRLAVYPNPTSDWVVFDLQGWNDNNYSIAIFDIIGRKVHQTKISNKLTRFDTSELAAGTYTIVVLDDQAILVSQKLVKTN